MLDDPSVLFARRAAAVGIGLALIALGAAMAAALATWTVSDPSLTHATAAPVRNIMGYPGAAFADPAMQLFGLAAPLLILPFPLYGLRLVMGRRLGLSLDRIGAGIAAIVLAPAFVAVFPATPAWPLPLGLGGVVGSAWHGVISAFGIDSGTVHGFVGGLLGLVALACLARAVTPPRVRTTEARPPFQIRRHGADLDEYGLDGTDTYETETSRFDALRGAVAHAALSLRARVKTGERRRERERPTLRSVLAATEPSLSQDRDVYRARREASEPARAPRQEPRAAARPAPVPEADEDAYAEDPAAAAPEPARAPESVRARRERETNAKAFSLPLRGPAARLRERVAATLSGVPDDDGAEAYDADPHDPYAADTVPPADVYDDEEDEDVDWAAPAPASRARHEETADDEDWDEDDEDPLAAEANRHAGGARRIYAPPLAAPRVTPPAGAMRPGKRIVKEAQPSFLADETYEFPPLALLATAPADRVDTELSEDALEANARVLEGVLEDFGVKGSIIHVRPGPVVTLYELEPAPGIKSSRVIGLADDIARSMSAISARVAVIPGKNAIGIELPNRRRVTVYLRELLASADFERTKQKLPMCLGKTIGGEAVIADLARMPHLLVAGTTGSGKSVSINTMILSLLYHHTPETCRIILIDPKMLELSVYDGIPHLLTPVVTDPKKAVSALRWAVREMEDRYRKMAKLGVRNIDGYNAKLREEGRGGEPLTRLVQTGFDKRTGEAIFEEEVLALEPIPFIVVIVDEMADLMMVAGKDIEGLIQRLAQMARAAGIHLIMATQRPSVDVITGTIKANFPTRISFQVTSKIDSRTILAEMGAEQLLGMGDMLYMAGGGRIQRVHGPFVSDEEVEDVVSHLKAQGVPDYLLSVLEEDEEDAVEDGEAGGFDALAESDDLYDRAVALVLRDRKASTSYVQRRLSIGYNRAATLIERMEREGVVSPANHAGKREILVPSREDEAA